MTRYVRRAGFRKVGEDAIDRLDHQVDVDWRADAVVAQRFANKRTDRQVRHEVIVHDIEMHDIRTCFENRFDVFAQPREVGGKN